jgi:PAS domain S-box-containing protein
MANEQINVLLVEDNPGDRRLIQEMLADLPDIVLSSADRLSAGLQILEESRIDIVLLDLSLPDSQGLLTLERIRKQRVNVPVVVMTGYNDANVGLQALQSGAQDYLIKGEVDSNLLIRALRYARERHRAEEALRKREEEYRSLIDDVFDDSSVAVFILDRNLQVVWINEATEDYFGLQRQQVIGRDTRELILESIRHIFEDSDTFAESLLSAYESNVYTESFICHVLADPVNGRQERWLEHWSQPIRAGLYAGGRIEQYMDITEHLRTQTAEREQRALSEALSDSIAALTSTLDLEEVFDRILENVRYVVPHDTADVMFVKDGIARVVRMQGYGAHDPTDRRLTSRLPLKDAPHLQFMCETGQAVIIPDVQNDPEWVSLPGDYWLHSCASAPIRLQSETLGFINLLSTSSGYFQPVHAERLQAFANHAAIAIQNARSYEKSRELAAVEERQRLARDLHDAVSQSLFSASVIAQSLPRLWRVNSEKVLDQLEYLDELTQSALTEMRMLLLELRPSALQDVALSHLVQQMVRTVETRKQIHVKTTIDDLSDLPPAIKIALYRIAQESLNNMAKHSQATEAVLSLRRQDGQIVLSLHDNGVGFISSQTSPTSLGLRIMHERAEEVGAELTIESDANSGTTITAVLPEATPAVS